jgi:hypothetical protein
MSVLLTNSENDAKSEMHEIKFISIHSLHEIKPAVYIDPVWCVKIDKFLLSLWFLT